MDENVTAWHARKTEKYRKMVAKVEGWTFFDFSLEVGLGSEFHACET
jgi:hypothetical protein